MPPLITDINLSLDDRSLYVSCWGTGEFALRRLRPVQPEPTGSARLGGIVSARRTPPPGPSTAGRRWSRSRDGKRVYLTNSLYASWDAQFYPEGIDGWFVKLDVGARAG